MDWFTILLVVLGAIAVVAYVSGQWLARTNQRLARELVREGKLHPDDIARIHAAARAGTPLYRWPDGRLRPFPPDPERG